MEEIHPGVGSDIGDVSRIMRRIVIDDHTTVTALVDGVRIIMFEEKKEEDPHYDGPQ